jgi:muramidase (phage lysozyme)
VFGSRYGSEHGRSLIDWGVCSEAAGQYQFGNVYVRAR